MGSPRGTPSDPGSPPPSELGPEVDAGAGLLAEVVDWLRPGRGPSRKVEVPDFVGAVASDRSLLAVRAGVRTRCVSTGGGGGAGIVVAQDPPAGTRVRRNSEVLLTLVHEP